MPRFLPLITGLGLAAAVTFHFKGKVSETSFDMHQRLNSVKKTLDNAVTLERNKTYGSPKYSSSQFVPSVKNSWNSQLINATHSLSKADFGAKAKGFLDEYIFKK